LSYGRRQRVAFRLASANCKKKVLQGCEFQLNGANKELLPEESHLAELDILIRVVSCEFVEPRWFI